jgi:hypothetical protein
MVTKWDKIVFVFIAVLLVLAIVFWNDLSGAFGGKADNNGKEDKKGKKERKKDADKKEGFLSPGTPPVRLAFWPCTPPQSPAPHLAVPSV